MQVSAHLFDAAETATTSYQPTTICAVAYACILFPHRMHSFRSGPEEQGARFGALHRIPARRSAVTNPQVHGLQHDGAEPKWTFAVASSSGSSISVISEASLAHGFGGGRCRLRALLHLHNNPFSESLEIMGKDPWTR